MTGTMTRRTSLLMCLLSLSTGLALTACGGGGGGGGGGSSAPPVEATLSGIAPGQALRGTTSGSSTAMSFTYTMSKPVISGVPISYHTADVQQQLPAGNRSALGFAVSGQSCTAGVDYIAVPSTTIVVPPGASSGTITVQVCNNAAFTATQLFNLSWTSNGQSGVQTGSIVSPVTGGLASTATTSGIGGTPTYGLDALSLTNSDTDGHLGLSYTAMPSTTTWQCTQDNVTGLVWQANPQINNASFNTYANLQAYVNQVNQAAPCGNTNWRLPTTSELASLVDLSVASTTAAAADMTGFPHMLANRYWTADMMTGTTTDAWYVDFGDQGVMAHDLMTPMSGSYSSYQVVLVSAAAPAVESCTAAEARYTDNGDGTVTDQSTQLMWKQCLEGTTGSTCTGTKTAFTSVAQITGQVKSVNASVSTSGLGYGDWRVPTVKELNSLVNRSCTGSTINSVAFPNTDAISQITATVYAPTPAFLWAVDFSNGIVSPVDPTSAGGRALRLVRAGR